jgi:hypothetical protein
MADRGTPGDPHNPWIRDRLFVQGTLVDEAWINCSRPDFEAVSQAVMEKHQRLAMAALDHGLPWLNELYDPSMPEDDAYVRFGTDRSMCVEPASVWTPQELYERLDETIRRRYGEGL